MITKFIKQVIKVRFVLVVLFLTSPVFVMAAGTLNGIEDAALELLNSIIPVFVAAAVVFFLWSVLKYVNSGDNVEVRIQARGLMVYGVVAIFVLVSVWGFVGLLDGVFNLDNSNLPVDPNDIILEM